MTSKRKVDMGMSKEWPFADERHTAVLTTLRVLARRHPVVYVTHDAEDGMWQFHDGEAVSVEEGRIVSLQEMMRLDPSVAELADLPLGWVAWRNSAADEWHRQKSMLER
ncbi:hypothetical protein [Paenibacillus thiaminolyticus]|uniref:hypothetical protein n=1 Tax=Paenibacillus thiaminolyticus TaxID=49283 RepID=UPI002175FD80|nr:hypothetical protein [Paenibacillus thiaminolyticus]